MAARAKAAPVPDGVGASGAALWRRLTGLTKAGAPIEFSAGELVTLELACRQADDVARLEAVLEADGATVTGSKGQVKLSSVPAELRLQRAALARLIGALEIPADSEEVGLSPTKRRARAAADARWSRQAAAREERKHSG